MKYWLVLYVAAVLCLGSCGKQQDDPLSDKVSKKLTIAVIPQGTMHEFWKSIHAGAAKAGEELGVEIIWKGPLREDDREDQIKVVENMIIREVDGIVLAPLDDVALRIPVKNATARGIPVVVFDTALQSDDPISLVATDNFVGGQKGGDHLAKLIGKKGKALLLRYSEGTASTAKREAGFLEAIGKYPDIEVVSSNQYAGVTVETAMQASENILAPLRSSDGGLRLDGIFTPNESSTFGMLRALKDSNWAGTVTFVGFDSSEQLVKALAAGELHGLVLQDPVNMGYTAVKTLVKHLQGEPIEGHIDTGSTLVTSENYQEPALQALLKPEQFE